MLKIFSRKSRVSLGGCRGSAMARQSELAMMRKRTVLLNKGWVVYLKQAFRMGLSIVSMLKDVFARCGLMSFAL